MKSKSQNPSFKNILIGKPRDISDAGIFHKMSLIAIFAWVGLGADGLSSSCYGPEETMKVLAAHPSLSLFVSLACIFTIAVICASYSQIIEMFPGGGGGYLVASKLLSPSAGVVSGCALLIDYVLTIAISIAAGADALFSVLPSSFSHWKMPVALGALVFLTVLNLRGVKESVLIWAPIFFLFLATHVFAIVYGFFCQFSSLPEIARATISDVTVAHAELGWVNLGVLLLTAFSLGAGSYTGIEAVSNGLPILREPRVATGKRTMVYMGVSLAFMVGGLLLMYQLYHSESRPGMTLNAILFTQITQGWPNWLSNSFLSMAMFSAAALLFIAAQAGFLDGPRVLSNMALDRWFPARFATLSDRLVAHNGILLMAGASFVLLWISHGAVGWLVVLYAINVFITFTLSQLGMVVHWSRDGRNDPARKRKLAVNAVGLMLTTTILIALSVIKFHDGGWITILVTSSLIALAFYIKRHYNKVGKKLSHLNSLVESIELNGIPSSNVAGSCNPNDKTAVIFVNGYNGLGLHSLLGVQRQFTGVFKNFVFAEIGVVDTGNFKGSEEITNLKSKIEENIDRYVTFMSKNGFHAKGFYQVGTEVVSTSAELAEKIRMNYPHAVFFGGQIVFEDETFLTRLLHNFAVFTMQREFFRRGLTFFVMPIKV